MDLIAYQINAALKLCSLEAFPPRQGSVSIAKSALYYRDQPTSICHLHKIEA